MPRNVRQKQPSKPARAPKRRDSVSSSSLGLSDDSGYSGVEDLSDSEDDDEDHVFAAEEEHIITNARRKRASDPPRSLVEDDDDDDDDEAEVEDVDVVGDAASWAGFSSDNDDLIPAEPVSLDLLNQVSVTPSRHVRFIGVPDSDSDSTTSETSEIDDIHGFFPDIFVEQSSLDPRFRREIEDDDDTSSNGSFWDFHSGSHDMAGRQVGVDDDDAAQDQDATPTVTPRHSQPPADMSAPVTVAVEVQELDGYETDGDTTEEDIPEPIIRKKHMRRSHTVEPSSDSDTEKPIQSRPGRPRVGRFNLDRSDNKPIGVVDPATGKMIIFTPRRTNQLDLSPESLHLDFSLGQDLTASPLVRNPGLIMMGAMASSNTFGDFMNMQPFGPAEAFFPCTPGLFPGEDESDDSYFAGIEEEEDEEESLLKIEDFVTFNHDSSDDEEEEVEEEVGGVWNGDLMSSPTRPKTAASNASTGAESSAAAHPLLTHFDGNSDAVGAFRRNQINQQLIYSDKASQESLAFSGPYYHGTLRGIKTGSMETVTAPITPIRRQKRSNTVGSNSYADIQQSSPLGAMSQKRKASSNHTDANLHKRHRSISDVGVLQI
ncbi:hypothetical protein B0J18DRAFT_234893 [Chaetomium sp. MPI-SDFR-AT-0129]|nr:hypothetical protein B0J18DRAFT_234893 [Chaetomium sp. MPI-SDFR-AT-0129]